MSIVGTCDKCGREIDSFESVGRLLIGGFTVTRSAGGPNHVLGAQYHPSKIYHGRCAESIAKNGVVDGINENQGGLFS